MFKRLMLVIALAAGLIGGAAAPALADTTGDWLVKVIGRDDAEVAKVKIKVNGNTAFNDATTDLPLDHAINDTAGVVEVRAQRTDNQPGPFQCQVWFNGVMWDFAFTTDATADVSCRFDSAMAAEQYSPGTNAVPLVQPIGDECDFRTQKCYRSTDAAAGIDLVDFYCDLYTFCLWDGRDYTGGGVSVHRSIFNSVGCFNLNNVGFSNRADSAANYTGFNIALRDSALCSGSQIWMANNSRIAYLGWYGYANRVSGVNLS